MEIEGNKSDVTTMKKLRLPSREKPHLWQFTAQQSGGIVEFHWIMLYCAKVTVAFLGPELFLPVGDPSDSYRNVISIQ